MITFSHEALTNENEGYLSSISKCGSINNKLKVYLDYILPSLKKIINELDKESTINFSLD